MIQSRPLLCLTNPHYEDDDDDGGSGDLRKRLCALPLLIAGDDSFDRLEWGMTLLEKKMSALDIIFDVVTITIFMLSMNLPVFPPKIY